MSKLPSYQLAALPTAWHRTRVCLRGQDIDVKWPDVFFSSESPLDVQVNLRLWCQTQHSIPGTLAWWKSRYIFLSLWVFIQREKPAFQCNSSSLNWIHQDRQSALSLCPANRPSQGCSGKKAVFKHVWESVRHWIHVSHCHGFTPLNSWLTFTPLTRYCQCFYRSCGVKECASRRWLLSHRKNIEKLKQNTQQLCCCVNWIYLFFLFGQVWANVYDAEYFLRTISLHRDPYWIWYFIEMI